MRHSSVAQENDKGFKESNERLEYLGDAVLGMVVAEYLFAKFPYRNEGFLTEIRSRLVNRETLNNLSKKIGLKNLVEYDKSLKSGISHKSIYGDTLEALIGAIYMDKGFKFCRQFIIKKLINNHYDLDEIVHKTFNFKSKIIEWAQKENKNIRFEIDEISDHKNVKKFKAQVYIDDQPFGSGAGLSKKKAEQNASQKSCESLNIV